MEGNGHVLSQETILAHIEFDIDLFTLDPELETKEYQTHPTTNDLQETNHIKKQDYRDSSVGKHTHECDVEKVDLSEIGHTAISDDIQKTASINSIDDIETIPTDTEFEKTLIQRRLEMEKEAETRAKVRQSQWAKTKKTLNDAINELFKDHIELYEKAHTLRLHFEDEKNSLLRTLQSRIGNVFSPVDDTRGQVKRPYSEVDDGEEFNYIMDNSEKIVLKRINNWSENINMEHCRGTQLSQGKKGTAHSPFSVRKRQKPFHTPEKLDFESMD